MKHDYVLCSSEEGYHRVVYTEWGQADFVRPAIVCVHGLARNRHDFNALSTFLSQKRKRHVFCPDIAGRGDSDWFKNPKYYNFIQYVSDMTTLISRTANHDIDWIGTSMGGIIGMMIASLPNTPIRRLILNDVGPQIPIHALWRLGKYVGKNPEFASPKQAKAYFKKIYTDFGDLTEEQWSEFTENSIKETQHGAYAATLDPAINEARAGWQFMREFVHNPYKALEGVLFDVDLWQHWQNIKCPVLVIRGHHSDLLLPEHLRKMQRSHPATEIYEVQNAGHAPALLDPEQHQVIAEWLDRSLG